MERGYRGLVCLKISTNREVVFCLNLGSASGKDNDSELAKKRAMIQLMTTNKQSVVNSLSSLNLDATGSVFRGYVTHAIGFATSQYVPNFFISSTALKK